MMILMIVASLAGGLALAMGLKALVDPTWTMGLVRLVPDPEKVEGRSELRAIYGGVYSGGHVFALAALWLGGAGGSWAAAAIGAGWLTAGVVRAATMKMDGGASPYNQLGAGFEVVVGLALMGPWMAVLLG
ncbi:MAG: DUF4345 family protein [Maricaulaceae bacterium]